MFTIAILVHAIVSDGYSRYSIGEFPSFEQCEAERPKIAEVLQITLERRHSQPVVIESKCVKSGGSA